MTKRLTNEAFERIKKQVKEEIDREEMKKMGFSVKMNEYLNPERWI